MIPLRFAGRLVTMALLFALTFMTRAAVPPADATARQVVDALESALIEAMKAGGGLTLEQRRDRLAPVVERALDVPRMGRFIFGSRWRELGPDQRERFITAFTELSTTTYAARFDQHKGERFDPISETAQGEDRRLVRSRFTKGSGDTVSFDYLMMRSGGEWRIVNILTDGISDLALKRSQYSALYAKGGMDAVIDHIDDQVRRLHEE